MTVLNITENDQPVYLVFALRAADFPPLLTGAQITLTIGQHTLPMSVVYAPLAHVVTILYAGDLGLRKGLYPMTISVTYSDPDGTYDRVYPNENTLWLNVREPVVGSSTPYIEEP